MTSDVSSNAITRGIVDLVDGDRLHLRVPHTDYLLSLTLTVPPDQMTTPPGRRITGTIEASALRIHPVGGGGKFMEPIRGEPRIVTGTVRVADEEGGRVLVDVAVPMWLTTLPQQDFDVIRPGGLVTCYLASGATFTPVPG